MMESVIRTVQGHKVLWVQDKAFIYGITAKFLNRRGMMDEIALAATIG